MAEDQFNASVDGQEFATADANLVGTVSGLADDRVLSEILRLTPYDGTNVYKTILPYGSTPIQGSAGSTNPGTVQSTGSANGSINVNPFRGVVGSRTAVGTSPLKNWRDTRSAVFVGPSALAQTIQLAANGSGNPRWDLVYATVSVDVASGSLTRRVKNPGNGNIAAATYTTKLTCPIVITVLQGTPGGPPALPALPADSGGNYNIALAYVRVPNTFGSSTTVAPQDIRDAVKISLLTSPSTGSGRLCAASGNNDQAGTYDTDPAGPGVWTPGTSGQRPGTFVPPGMLGWEDRVVLVDANSASHPSHANTSIVDDTIDWRNRYTEVVGQVASSGTQLFGSDPNASGGNCLPLFSGTAATQMGNTFCQDATLVAASSTLASFSGGAFGLYVLAADGKLRWFTNGSVTTRIFMRVRAYGQFPNK